MEHEALTRRIIGCAMRVHGALGPGFLEAVYQRALAWELRSAHHAVECERRLVVHYRECAVGGFVPDLIVDGCVILEIKAVTRIVRAHQMQFRVRCDTPSVRYTAAVSGADVGSAGTPHVGQYG